MLPDSMLSGENAVWLDQQYRSWLDDPESVDAHWADVFAQLETTSEGGRRAGDLPSFQPRSIFAATVRSTSGVTSEVAMLINAYRVRGHMEADIDPLGRRERKRHPELELSWHGLSEGDLDREVPTAPLYGVPPRLPLRDVIAHCRKAYCGAIGAEFMNIMDSEQKQWVLQWLETLPNRQVLDRDAELRVLRKLCDAENFERMLHTRFPGTKRFSLEGGETLVPLLDLVVSEAGRRGVQQIVMGMAHRGRLNTLVNIFEKPAHLIVGEFQDTRAEQTQGSGDVKYHLGYSGDAYTIHGDRVHLSLTPNPSHLEAVDPVVEGRVRAKQDREDGEAMGLAMPVLIHGDAAFSGQGLVMETLNLSELEGYATGGTIHVIVNNQIGFTTPPREGRSTPYCTDIARMLAVPILHVNGEDPRAVAAAVQLAVEWRQRYHRDVVIDMYCYRLHGHNEGDEPSFTQPAMYKAIRARSTPRQNYADFLTRNGYLTENDVNSVFEASKAAMWEDAEEAGEVVRAPTEERALELKERDPDLRRYDEIDTTVATRMARPEPDANLKGRWLEHVGGDIREETDTGVSRERLVELMQGLQEIPEGFEPHNKIKRLLRQRLEVAAGTRPVDWAMGEVAAFATLLDEGHSVRLSGQDSGRGTFSHRHAVLTDAETGSEIFPLASLGSFSVIDSSLSEAAVLGFEFGYSLDTPDGLVLWEAQFGDFVNGAQIIIDQFITAAEQKWGRLSALTMLLPHGYEGQGPEHSSARLERFLLACGDDNIQVANMTTPANLFHALRRQVKRKARKPLVVMTPKSLLRHAEAVSTLDDLADGAFQSVIPEIDDSVEASGVERVVFCSGKVYFELLAARRQRLEDSIALVRVELLHPWPADGLDAVIAQYPDSAELVWCQEEPRNMGAWPVILHWWMEHVPLSRLPRYVGRPAAASPATGSHKKHVAEQARLIAEALTL